MEKIQNKFLISGLLLTPAISLAEDFTFRQLSENIYMSFIGMFINLFLVFAVVFFAWGVMMFIFSEGDKKESAKDRLFWATVALFVMFSFWGILRIFSTTFLGDFETQEQYQFESTFTQFSPDGGRIGPN